MNRRPTGALVAVGLKARRPDDEPEAIERRLSEFDHRTAPIIDYYRELGKLVIVDATLGSVDNVAEAIRFAIEEHGRR